MNIFRNFKATQLSRNMHSGVIFSAGNVILTIVAYPIYLKSLGAELYGLWATLSVILAFVDLGQLGIGTAIIKSIAGEYEKKDYLSLSEYFSTAFIMLLATSSIILILLYIFRIRIAEIIAIRNRFGNLGIDLVFLVGLLSAISFFVNTIRGIIAGIGRIDIANYVFLLARILQIILTIVFLKFNFGIWSIYWAYLLYLIIPSIIWIGYLYKFHNINLLKLTHFNKNKFRALFKYGSTYIGGLSAGLLIVPLNKVFIANYVGFEAVAYYQIALQVVLSIRNLFFKAMEAILPDISAASELKDDLNTRVNKYYRKGKIFVYYYGIPVFVVTFIFSTYILKLWLGKEFDIAISYTLRILLLGWLFNLLATPDYFFFLGMGKVIYTTIEEWLRAGINVMLMLVFVLLFHKANLFIISIANSTALIIGYIYYIHKSKFLLGRSSK